MPPSEIPSGMSDLYLLEFWSKGYIDTIAKYRRLLQRPFDTPHKPK